MSFVLAQGEARLLPLQDASVHTCVTSPPYWGLRSYNIGVDHGEIGQETTHDCLAWARQEPPCAACWVCAMRAVFAEVWRVLRPDGTLWCNVGDSYVGGNQGGTYNPATWQPLDHPGSNTSWTTRQQRTTIDMAAATNLKPKNLLGLPWRLALALQADGFLLRSELIWHKLNPMPESVQDRPTRAHEQVFLFSKTPRYYFDMENVREVWADHRHGGSRTTSLAYSQLSGRNGDSGLGPPPPYAGRAMRTVWSLASEPFSGSHFATFPTELVRRCLRAGAPAQVCSVCAAPWVRQVERGLPSKETTRGRQAWTAVTGQRDSAGGLPLRPIVTTGFAPSCTCNALTQPCTVFDPFCGSGTTLLVARELGHHAVGLDLSYPYLHDIARERLGLAEMERWLHGFAAPQAENYADLPLFGG
jgi:DNA modification methylase